MRTPFVPATIAICLALAVFLPAAGARDLYVNNVAGDDLFDGAAPRSVHEGYGPFRTLRRALRAAEAGDRIILANTGQLYRESVSLVGSRHCGTASQPFVIEGNGAVFDGSRPVPYEAWQHAGGDVFRFLPERLQYETLFLDGVPAVRRPYSTLSGRRLDLEPLEWASVDGWIHFRVENGKLPQDYNLSYAALPAAFTLYKVDDVIIDNLVIQGYQLDGVYLNDATGPCLLRGLTCRGNARSGVAVRGASKVNIDSCLIGDNGQCQVLVDGYSTVDLSNCDLPDNASPKWQVSNGAKLLLDGQPEQPK